MTGLPFYTFLAGCFFALLAFAFFWMAYNNDRPETDTRRIIVVYVCAFSAGSSGAFFTGTALLNATVAIGAGSTLTFSGAAGVALFALVIFLFRKFIRPSAPVSPPAPVPGKPATTVAPGTATPLSQVAKYIAQQVNASVDLSALNSAEKALIPDSVSLPCRTMDEATASLFRLQHIVPDGSIRPYKVELDKSSQHFTLVLV